MLHSFLMIDAYRNKEKYINQLLAPALNRILWIYSIHSQFKLIFMFVRIACKKNKIWERTKHSMSNVFILWTLRWNYGHFEECCFRCLLTSELLFISRFIDRSHNSINWITHEGQREWTQKTQYDSWKTRFRENFRFSALGDQEWIAVGKYFSL